MRESDEDREARKFAEAIRVIQGRALDIGASILEMQAIAKEFGCVLTFGAEPVEKHAGAVPGQIVILPPPWEGK